MLAPVTIHGRAHERAALEAAVAPGAPGACLALVGEAGIGKSALARHAAEAAREAGRPVIEGYSTLGLAEPLGVICDAVRAAGRAGLVPGGRDRLATGFPALVLPELGAARSRPATWAPPSRRPPATCRPGGPARPAGGAGGPALGRCHQPEPDPLPGAGAARASRWPWCSPTAPTTRPAHPRSQACAASFAAARLGSELVLGPLSPDQAGALLAEILGLAPAPEVRRRADAPGRRQPLRPGGAGRRGAGVGLDRCRLWEAGGHRAAGASLDPGRVDPGPRRRPGAARARADRVGGGHRRALRPAAAERGRRPAPGPGPRPAREPDRRGPGGRGPGRPGRQRLRLPPRPRARGPFARGAGGPARGRATGRSSTRPRRWPRTGALETSSAQLARHALAAGDREPALTHSRAAADRARELGAVEEAAAHLERALGLWSHEDGPRLRAELLFACGRLRTRLARGDERAAGFLEQARAEYLDLGDEGAAAWSLAVARRRPLAGRREQASLSGVGARHPGSPTDGPAGGPALGAHDVRARSRVREAGRCGGAGRRGGPGPGAGAATADEAFDRVSLLSTKGTIALWRCDATASRALFGEAVRLAIEHHDDLGAAQAHHLQSLANLLLCPSRGRGAGTRIDSWRHGLPPRWSTVRPGRSSWWRGTGCGSCRPTTSSAWRTWPSRRGIGRARAA